MDGSGQGGSYSQMKQGPKRTGADSLEHRLVGHVFLVPGRPAADGAEHSHIHRTNPMALPVPADER
jgi:hypothetical protein